MFVEFNNALKVLIYELGRIDPAEVDVTFKMPTKDWVESLVAPTINLFMFDLDENTDLRHTNMQTTRSGSIAITRKPPRRYDLHYMVTPLTTVIEDQGLLLWRLLATLTRYTPLPLEVLSGSLISTLIRTAPPLPSNVLSEQVQEALRSDAPLQPALLEELRPHLETRIAPLTTRVGKIDGNVRALDLWGALEIPPRPTLMYSVTVPMDLEIAIESNLVLSRSLRYRRTSPEDERAGRGIDRDRATLIGESYTIGGVVRDRQGRPLAGITIGIEGDAAEEVLTNDEGQYAFNHRVNAGQLRLRAARPGSKPQICPLTVPSETYDLTLE
ncbi:MAG: hypothetical protein OHK0022_15390 [Roseiflexaceae bacterium]